LPSHSEETYILAKYKDEFPKSVYLPLADYNSIMKVNNKKSLMEIAHKAKIPIPKSFSIKSENQIDEFKDQISYPCVLKLQTGTSSVGLSYCTTYKQLKTTLKETISKFNLKQNELPIIQEFIEGDGYGVSVLYENSKLKAMFTHKRLREYPQTGGPSTLRVSVKHPEMERLTKELMDKLNWHGIAMVEYKLTKDNKPYLIEINPRFWGSLNQAISAGVDFPYLIYKLARKQKFKPVLNYRINLRTRYYLNDIRALFFSKSKKYERSILDLFPRRNIPDDTLSLNDPMPGLVFLYLGFNQIFDKKYESN
jgi:predicted ATP-grasp superfamily ATP-dependent carboligase